MGTSPEFARGRDPGVVLCCEPFEEGRGMKNRLTGNALRAWARGAICLSAAIAILAISPAGRAGQKKKKPAADTDNSSDQSQAPVVPVSTFDEIDHDIGEMLGAFQVGDVEAMHKYYSDNATFVRGVYEPPLVGWQNYVAEYQRERAAFQGMQLIRRNTTVFTHGDVAWASYQWEFGATLNNGRSYVARGQTTLVLTKVGENWLIVHNHTSEICPMAAAPPAATQQPPPQQAPEGTAPESAPAKP
jgi:ketosteroid isomerase-like protein